MNLLFFVVDDNNTVIAEKIFPLLRNKKGGRILPSMSLVSDLVDDAQNILNQKKGFPEIEL